MGKNSKIKQQLDDIKHDPKVRKLFDMSSLKGGKRTTTTCSGVVPQ